MLNLAEVLDTGTRPHPRAGVHGAETLQESGTPVVVQGLLTGTGGPFGCTRVWI